MLSDSVDFGLKAQSAGSDVTVEVYPMMWHCFTAYCEGCHYHEATPLIEAVKAIKSQG
jgi:acetyl esterase/lipase